MTALSLYPEAKDDIAQIWIDYSAYDPLAADRMLDRILVVFRRLMDFPRSGRTRDSLSPGLRSVRVKTHVIFYRIEGRTVGIVRVLHGRRDFEAVFGQPK